LTFKGGNGKAWASAARWAALVATIGLGAATLGGGACSAAPNNTDFSAGGAGSTQSGMQSGTQSGGTQSGTQSGGTQSGGMGGSGVGFVVAGAGGLGSGNGSMSGGFGGACASSHAEGKVSPLDIYIMLDKSGSMNDANKWINCTTALKT